MISGEFNLTELKNVENKTARPKTAQARIAALKAAGIDTSNYFPMGEDMVVKVVDGVPVQVMDDDPVYGSIANGGYIGHYKLFRRWVMSQMFHMLRDMEQSGKSFNALLQHKGYEYSFRMLEKELYDQMKMHEHGDVKCFSQRNRWFNKDVAYHMLTKYIDNLHDYVEDKLIYRQNSRGERVPKHTCKGVAYVRIGGKNIFVTDLNKKVYEPLLKLACRAANSASPKELWLAVRDFNRTKTKITSKTKQDDHFIDAYKGSGAYFTMRNLVMFHGARFFKSYGGKMNESESLSRIEESAVAYSNEGWRMMGVLKQLINESGISVSAKIDEWRK